jgi:hypothetical protein
VKPGSPFGNGRAPLALALLLLPVLGARRLRRQGQRQDVVFSILLLFATGVSAPVLSGCGGHTKSAQPP